MENEKRLIDANSLSRRLFPIAMNLAKEYGSIGGAVSGVIGHIYDEPTVDAVEVVRCRECKHRYNGKDCTHPLLLSYSFGAIRNVKDNDFCSYGERKEGAN